MNFTIAETQFYAASVTRSCCLCGDEGIREAPGGKRDATPASARQGNPCRHCRRGGSASQLENLRRCYRQAFTPASSAGCCQLAAPYLSLLCAGRQADRNEGSGRSGRHEGQVRRHACLPCGLKPTLMGGPSSALQRTSDRRGTNSSAWEVSLFFCGCAGTMLARRLTGCLISPMAASTLRTQATEGRRPSMEGASTEGASPMRVVHPTEASSMEVSIFEIFIPGIALSYCSLVQCHRRKAL